MGSEEREPESLDYRALVREVVQGEGFARLTAQGAALGAAPWVRVVVRPVLVRGRRRLQFSSFDGRKDVTRNLAGAEAEEKLDEVLALPFRQFHVRSTGGDVHVRITKRGKALVQREQPRVEAAPSLAHDRAKQQPLPANQPDAFLQVLGVTDAAGKVRSAMHAKFRQINEFVRLLEEALGDAPVGREERLEIVDCGSGAAYLTFAAYHHLSHVRGLPTRVTGVDVNAELVEKSRQLRDELGWEGLEFHTARIREFMLDRPPHVTLSLHACDTATDEAIARGVQWRSQVILAAPCCQHEFSAQLAAPLFQPLLRHGLFRQRMADLLTDTFRALALRIMGYRTDVVEFVSPEHTAKNLMLRGRRLDPPTFPPEFAQEYLALREFWSVRPAIEELLGEELTVRLAGPGA